MKIYDGFLILLAAIRSSKMNVKMSCPVIFHPNPSFFNIFSNIYYIICSLLFIYPFSLRSFIYILIH